MPFIK
ncbi:ed83dc67-f9f6-4529-97c1-194b162e9a95 [Thermothielavioides terrestris]